MFQQNDTINQGDLSMEDLGKMLENQIGKPADANTTNPPATPSAAELLKPTSETVTLPATSAPTPAAATPPTTETTPSEPQLWEPEWMKTQAPDPNSTSTQAPAATEKPVAQPDPNEKYIPLLNNPEVRFMLDQMATTGKSLFEVQKEITLVDYDKMSPIEVYKHTLELHGATPEDLQEDLEKFKSLKVHEQNMEADKLRQPLKAKQEARMNEISQKNRQAQDQEMALVMKTKQELESYIPTLKGQKRFDHEITEPMVNKALDRFYNGVPEWKNPDGSPNVKRFIDDMLILDNFTEIARTQIRNAQTAGRGEILTEVQAGNANQGGHVPGMLSGGSIEDAVMAKK